MVALYPSSENLLSGFPDPVRRSKEQLLPLDLLAIEFLNPNKECLTDHESSLLLQYLIPNIIQPLLLQRQVEYPVKHFPLQIDPPITPNFTLAKH